MKPNKILIFNWLYKFWIFIIRKIIQNTSIFVKQGNFAGLWYIYKITQTIIVVDNIFLKSFEEFNVSSHGKL